LLRLLCGAALAGASVLPSACFVSTDLGGTSFLCSADEVCPDGLRCVDGQCVGGGRPDAGPGGGGGGGGGTRVDSGGGSGGGQPDAGEPPAGGFAFREQLFLDNATRGQLNDFPLLVALDAARIDYAAVRADGADIEFRDADDTPLAHEIERWDPQGTSILWVRVPQIDAASNTDSIWMYYGDPAAQVAQDAVTVWGSYEEVYHLGDNGQVINDSSARNYDGTSLGTDPVAGFVGLAQNFAGAGQRVDLGNQRDFARAVAGLTIEAWVNPRASQNDGVVLGVARSADTVSRAELRVQANQTVRGSARTPDNGQGQDVATIQTIPLNAWSWLAVVYDFGADQGTIYIDGLVAQATPGLQLAPLSSDAPSSVARIGANEPAQSNNFFDGFIDEVRVAPAAMPADWVSAQNASMRDQLVTYSAPETL